MKHKLNALHYDNGMLLEYLNDQQGLSQHKPLGLL